MENPGVRDFIEKTNELKNTRYLRSLPKKLKLNISWSEEGGGKSEINNPDWDSLKAFAVTFRLFYLKNEPIYFKKVVKHLLNNISEETIKNKVKKYDEVWDHTLLNSPIPFKLDNSKITPREIINLFLYNEITHLGDPKKRQKLKGLRFGSIGVVDYIFHISLLHLTQCIFGICDILESNSK